MTAPRIAAAIPAAIPAALSRRDALALAGAAATLAMPRIARAAAPFQQPPLPYEESALAPTISARTVGLHYGKHHKGYYDKLNTLVAGKPYADMSLEEVVVASRKANDAPVFNNAAQAWNHDLYWMEFKGGPNPPKGAFADTVKRDFGDLAGLKKAMTDTGDGVFGTGWVWLVRDGDKLAVVGLKDAINPLPDGKTVLAGIDVWEHAYYLDWENRRTAHVKAVLDDRMNWAYVSERFG
ncbi:superoxide dismutase [Xanthobacter pseudotagetidis]|uniref:superoxide dismutase n=1 Tax=Xanthobacter pseudotagetidis TaxID=3119911 RepID=UPI0037267C7E